MSAHNERCGVGVSRRFGLRAMAAFMVLFAGVFALLKVFDVPVAVVAFLVAYLVALSIGQAFLFRGRDPRIASVYVGLFFYPISVLSLSEIFHPEISSGYTCILVTAIHMGAVSGYVFGAILASIFLFIREPESKPVKKPDRVE